MYSGIFEYNAKYQHLPADHVLPQESKPTLFHQSSTYTQSVAYSHTRSPWHSIRQLGSRALHPASDIIQLYNPVSASPFPI